LSPSLIISGKRLSIELKTRFPGKFTADIDTDSIIEAMLGHSQLLQNPDEEIINKCTIGALGSAMEETLDALTAALRTIKRKGGRRNACLHGKGFGPWCHR
jgi:hypothetical protein